MPLIIANIRLVDTKNAYKREANNNLKELKTIMNKLTVQDTSGTTDKVLTDTKGGSVTVWAPPPKGKKLRHLSCKLLP